MEIAVQHHQVGNLKQAEHSCRLVLQKEPDHPVALHLLAVIAYQTGRYNVAIDLVGKAIASDPQTPEFHNTRGIILKALGRFEEAMDSYERAISLKPDYAEVYNNMGNALSSQGQYAAAIERYEKAVLLKPNYEEAYNHMGIALQYCGDHAAAIKKCRQAVCLKPDYAEAYNTMASILLKQGLYVEAIENYRQALRLKPDYVQAHCNLGITLLLCGRFDKGWEEYNWRLRADNVTYPHRYTVPCWDGSTFVGKRLLVHYEQGLGDNIQFVRYLPMVKARGGTVIYETRKSLFGLLRAVPGIDELIEASLDSRPALNFDYYVPLMELPRIFGTKLETIPSRVPYLYADPTKVAYWRKRLIGSDLKVGIVWAGKTTHSDDCNRSCSLEHFVPLTQIQGVRLYGLQVGKAAEQTKELAEKMGIKNLADELRDFTDTAGVISSLDLLISVDTAVVHLAGAMGSPVWTLLPFVPDWRWLLQRQDSPWYPTMRLFRQTKLGDWTTVLKRVAEELQMLVGKQEIGRKKSSKDE